jgi:hypothetical protein
LANAHTRIDLISGPARLICPHHLGGPERSERPVAGRSPVGAHGQLSYNYLYLLQLTVRALRGLLEGAMPERTVRIAMVYGGDDDQERSDATVVSFRNLDAWF